MMKQPGSYPKRGRGFSRASSLVQARVRDASAGRGFAETRVLTHWAEIVGDAIAQTTEPVNVAYAKGGIGATLTVLTTGAMAPMVEMQKEQIRDKVNACYGYRAIARVRITQTAPTGFAEGRVAFSHAPKAAPAAPDPQVRAQAAQVSKDVASDDLRRALEALATNVLSKRKT